METHSTYSPTEYHPLDCNQNHQQTSNMFSEFSATTTDTYAQWIYEDSTVGNNENQVASNCWGTLEASYFFRSDQFDNQSQNSNMPMEIESSQAPPTQLPQDLEGIELSPMTPNPTTLDYLNHQYNLMQM